MITSRLFVAKTFATALVLVAGTVGQAQAGQVITNGGFEAGLSGWTSANQAFGDGSFFVQSGTASPINGDPVPAPPGGLNAAMTDGGGPGSHVLYQDFMVKTGSIASATISFDLFIGNRAGAFFNPAGGSLDFGIAAFNQQARVDILKGGTDPFSVAGADVLKNLYQSKPGDPPVAGYITLTTDLTTLFLAHSGEILRLRFAETDNVGPLQLGVDNVGLDVTSVPEPSTLFACGLGAIVGLAALIRRRAS